MAKFVCTYFWCGNVTMMFIKCMCAKNPIILNYGGPATCVSCMCVFGLSLFSQYFSRLTKITPHLLAQHTQEWARRYSGWANPHDGRVCRDTSAGHGAVSQCPCHWSHSPLGVLQTALTAPGRELTVLATFPSQCLSALVYMYFLPGLVAGAINYYCCHVWTCCCISFSDSSISCV